MAEEDEGRGADLQQKAQEQNSNLRRLIDAVGGLLSSSRELLSKLHAAPQQGDGANAPTAEDEAAKTRADGDPNVGRVRDGD
jgi:hypothetical protein